MNSALLGISNGGPYHVVSIFDKPLMIACPVSLIKKAFDSINRRGFAPLFDRGEYVLLLSINPGEITA